MADSYLIRGKVDTAEELKEKMIDNGDGTYSSGVAVTGSSVVYTTATHTQPAITTATTVALAANANAKYRLFVNDSDTVIYLKIAVSAVLNQGIRLNAYGGSYEMSTMLGNLNTGVVNAIHGGSGNKALLVTEGV
jgi:hypothetical protein